MIPMTPIPGAPDKSQAIPGMAFFAGTGPAGKTCGDCMHRGYYRETKSGNSYSSYKVSKCAVFKKLTGTHGADIRPDNHACKYFEGKNK